tara:strand:- start:355 stop:1977 length:1623 start_codon:yes stop_codon:yes gene_type:complete
VNILGIHGGFTINQHDPAAALICDGKLVACVEEERLFRIKTARGILPIESIRAVLKEAGLRIQDIDLVATPGETYGDIVERISAYFLHHFGYAPPVRPVNHQSAHLASAFFPSGFNRALCLSYDAHGDGLSGAYGTGNDQGVDLKGVLPRDNSLGLFYATMTSFLGFMPGEDEYKIMGLAPYGDDPVDLSFFARPADDGYFVDHSYVRQNPPPSSVFEQFYNEALTNKIGAARHKGEEITQHHRNIAAGIQKALETCATSLVTHLLKVTGEENLCLAGGVALNCSANNVINKLPDIKNLYVQPAASDRGLALGCALHAAHQEGENIQPIEHVFYGPSFDESAITRALELTGFSAEKVADPAVAGAELLSEGCIIGWYQGRSEFGPRALGHRSILADPSRDNMKDEINSRVKFREEFRPFAPSVLEERASEIFVMDKPSPFMTIAFDVRDGWGEKLPAITHVNNTARVQTVSRDIDPLYHSLISEFDKRTGIPLVLNTSFNIKGQPIVETPLEALSTFAGTGLDALIMGSYLVRKSGTPRA